MNDTHAPPGLQWASPTLAAPPKPETLAPPPFSAAVRRGDLVLTGACMAPPPARLGSLGDEAAGALASLAEALDAVACHLQGVVHLTVFFAQDLREEALIEALTPAFPVSNRPTLTAVPVPYLPQEGRMVVEAMAISRPGDTGPLSQAVRPKDHLHTAFPPAVRVGPVVCVGAQLPVDGQGQVLAPDEVAVQARLMIDRLNACFTEAGADPNAICRINTFYRGQALGAAGRDEWKTAAEVRGNAYPWPGPVGTGVPVPQPGPPGATLRQEAMALVDGQGQPLPRHGVRPDTVWDWPIKVTVQQGLTAGGLVFVGGQVPQNLDGTPKHPGDLVAQARECLTFIRLILAEYGLGWRDCARLRGYFKATEGGDIQWLHAAISAAAGEMVAPGTPVWTLQPLPSVGRDDLDVEIEALAVMPTQSK